MARGCACAHINANVACGGGLMLIRSVRSKARTAWPTNRVEMKAEGKCTLGLCSRV